MSSKCTCAYCVFEKKIKKMLGMKIKFYCDEKFAEEISFDPRSLGQGTLKISYRMEDFATVDARSFEMH